MIFLGITTPIEENGATYALHLQQLAQGQSSAVPTNGKPHPEIAVVVLPIEER